MKVNLEKKRGGGNLGKHCRERKEKENAFYWIGKAAHVLKGDRVYQACLIRAMNMTNCCIICPVLQSCPILGNEKKNRPWKHQDLPWNIKSLGLFVRISHCWKLLMLAFISTPTQIGAKTGINGWLFHVLCTKKNSAGLTQRALLHGYESKCEVSSQKMSPAMTRDNDQ